LSAVSAIPDTSEFERLFREHYGSLCRFAVRLGAEPARAEELVQGVFTTLWINRASWRVEHSARAYLFAAVRNASLNERKHLQLVRGWEEEEARELRADQLAREPESETQLEQRETADRVQRAFAELPARCRLVMELRWREQLSYAEIAEALGISVKGVENQLARGLSRMRELVR
jgi:RNA polymerase sigma-70 factor (ECF subfamily)